MTEIRVQSSGHVCSAIDDETVLDAALRQGLAFPYGCRNGFCGSCKGQLVSGDVTYGEELPGALSEEDVAEGVLLCCQARPLTDVVIDVEELDPSKDIPIKTFPCKISRMERLNHDVMQLFLQFPESDSLQFLAGQYLEILLKDGEKRAFSIANAPHNNALIELHIRHIDGGLFTDQLFATLHEKDVLRIEGPMGGFYLRENSERPIICMAGGTGFAPIKGVLEHLFESGSTRPVFFYWGVRSREDLYLHDLPEKWVTEHPGFRYIPVLSEPQDGDQWSGRRGFVHEAILEDFDDVLEYDVYACGPPIMVNSGRAAFLAKGLEANRFYADSFEYAHDEEKTKEDEIC